MASIYAAPRGVQASTLHASTWSDNIELADGAAQAYTVPTDADFLLIMPIGDGIYINHTATAALPVGDIVDGTAAKPIPANTALLIEATPGGTLSMIRMGGVEVNVCVWCYAKRGMS